MTYDLYNLFMKEYFDVKKGVRCIAGHKYPVIDKQGKKVKTNPIYYVYSGEYIRMINPRIPKEEFNDVMKKIKTSHGFFFTFDSRVIDSFFPAIGRIEYICSSIVGINYSIDLDAPHDSLEKGAKRLNFFDYISEFNLAIEKITKRLDEIGEKYNIMFSGNGIYIMLGGYYEDIDGDVMNYVRDIDIEIENMKINFDLGNKLKVHIDNVTLAWNKYVKLPFQPHGSYGNRYSIPIPIGYIGDDKDNKDWIMRACSNLDKDNVNDIIKTANWRKIW